MAWIISLELNILLLSSPDKMVNSRTSYIYMSAFLGAGGGAGGWAITDQLAGHDAALSFLKFGAAVVLGLLALQVILLFKGKNRALYLVMFNIAFALALAWFMSCLILPVLWVRSIDELTRLLLGVLAVALYCSNIMKGVQIFKLRWAAVGDELLKKFYDQRGHSIDWDGLVRGLKMSVSIYIPGFPRKLLPVLYVLLVVSMLIGLSLRKIYPMFSTFAWGIPAAVVVSFFMQMIGLAVGQFLELKKMEKKGNILIRPK